MTIKYRKLDERKKVKLSFRIDNNTFSQLEDISGNNELSVTLRDIIKWFIKNKGKENLSFD
ncbi:MAG TPA: hypothetical protein VJG30_03875 [Candidatus Nanoarchaeia archaeon]|nr:hypothetical protein [Candidatus Nanoarchaeia archaeon]